jgi:hypothetical protein
MTTACPHCQKEIKNSYIGTRPNLNHFKCPHCKGFLKLKNARWENVKSFTVGLLIGFIWLVFIEFQILPKPNEQNKAITGITLLLLGIAGLGTYMLFWVRRKSTLIPLKSTGYTSHLKSTFIFLIVLPTMVLSIITGMTIHFQRELNDNESIAIKQEFKDYSQEILRKLDSNSLNESEKNKAIKTYAEIAAATNKFEHAYYRAIKTFLFWVSIALVIQIIGIIMSLFWLKKVGKIEKTHEEKTLL